MENIIENKQSTKPSAQLGWIRKTIILLIAIVTISYWFWASRYHYSSITLEDGESFPVRIQRTTGQNEVLYHGTWQPATILSSLEKPIQEVPPEELQKLTLNVKITTEEHEEYGVEDPVVYITVYNGSDFILKEITTEVIVKDFDGGEALNRPYQLLPRKEILQPKQSYQYGITPGFAIGPRQSLSTKVSSAKGVKP